MSTVEQLERQLRDGLGRRREPTTVNQYCAVLRRFCLRTGKTKWDRKDLLKYLDGLLASGHEIKSVTTEYYELKSIFRATGQDFDIDIRDLPKAGSGAYKQQPTVSVMDV